MANTLSNRLISQNVDHLLNFLCILSCTTGVIFCPNTPFRQWFKQSRACISYQLHAC